MSLFWPSLPLTLQMSPDALCKGSPVCLQGSADLLGPFLCPSSCLVPMLQVSLDVDQASSGQGGDRNKCLGITDHLVWALETVQVLRAPCGDGHEGKELVRCLNGMTRTPPAPRSETSACSVTPICLLIGKWGAGQQWTCHNNVVALDSSSELRAGTKRLPADSNSH